MTTAKIPARAAGTKGAAKERSKTQRAPSSVADVSGTRKTPTRSRKAASSAADGCERNAINAEERHALVQRTAYFLAEARGFAPGQELHDWFAAEAAVDGQWGKHR